MCPSEVRDEQRKSTRVGNAGSAESKDDLGSTDDIYTGDPVCIRDQVTVRFIGISVIEFDDDPIDGLELRFKVEAPHEDTFWQRIDEQRPRLFGLISDTVREKSEGALAVKEIKFQRGSIVIIVIVVFVKTWLVSHATLLGALASLFQLYKPAKKLIKYAIKTIRPLLTDLASWFKRFFDMPDSFYA